MSRALPTGHPDPLRAVQLLPGAPARPILAGVIASVMPSVLLRDAPVLHGGGDEEALPRFTLGTVFTEWELLSWATLAILLTAARLPLGRVADAPARRPLAARAARRRSSAAMVAAAMATVSGLGTYDDTLLSVHMVQHMILSMVVPLAMALGAPITLALRTLPRRPRRWLLVVLHSRVAKVLSFPPLTFTLFVITPWALYFSGWYPATLHHDYLHEMTHLHMVLVGCLFFWPLVGIDPLPGRITYPARMLLTVLTLPVPRLHGRHDHGPGAADRRRLVPRAPRGPDGRLAARRRTPTSTSPAASSGAPATPSGCCSSWSCSSSGCAPRWPRPSARTGGSTCSRRARREQRRQRPRPPPTGGRGHSGRRGRRTVACCP